MRGGTHTAGRWMRNGQVVTRFRKAWTAAEKLRRVWHDGQRERARATDGRSDHARNVLTTRRTSRPLWCGWTDPQPDRTALSGILDLEPTGIAHGATVGTHGGPEPHVPQYFPDPSVETRVTRLVEAEQLRVASLIHIEIGDQAIGPDPVRRIEWRQGKGEKGGREDGVRAKAGTRTDAASPPRPDTRTDATAPSGAGAIGAVVTRPAASADRRRASGRRRSRCRSLCGRRDRLRLCGCRRHWRGGLRGRLWRWHWWRELDWPRHGLRRGLRRAGRYGWKVRYIEDALGDQGTRTAPTSPSSPSRIRARGSAVVAHLHDAAQHYRQDEQQEDQKVKPKRPEQPLQSVALDEIRDTDRRSVSPGDCRIASGRSERHGRIGMGNEYRGARRRGRAPRLYDRRAQKDSSAARRPEDRQSCLARISLGYLPTRGGSAALGGIPMILTPAPRAASMALMTSW